jgi:PST family polysaccharide transporter
MIGGAQAVTILVSFVRAKMVAILVGPSGVGLMGILNTFNANIASVAGWGLGSTAIRTIGGAAVEQRGEKAASAIVLGRRLAWCGLFCVVILAAPVGYLTFSSTNYNWELLIAGVAVPFVILAALWTALLQSYGHEQAVAKTQILSALIGMLIGLPLIFFLGTLGIAISLLFASMVVAWMTWRNARLLIPDISSEHRASGLSELLKLGAALQVGAILSAAFAYFVRLMIMRNHGGDSASGLRDAGFYHAAFTLTGILPGVIFSSASSDFYPRVAAACDEDEARSLTETQIQASILLATPLLMCLMTVGDFLVHILFDAGFEPASDMLDWFVWATLAYLIAWPLGLWVMARRGKLIVALTQSTIGLAGLAAGWLLIPRFGLIGAAAAYLSSSAVYLLVLMIVLRRFSGRWLGFRTTVIVLLCASALFVGNFSAKTYCSGYCSIVLTVGTLVLCVGAYISLMKSNSKSGAA